MREPQLQDFLSELENEDFTLVQLLVYGNQRDNVAENLALAKITQTLWFLDVSRAESVADAIIRTYNKNKDYDYLTTVVKNLTQLYPLSQGVVLRLLQSFPKASEGLIDGMFVGREILERLYFLVKEFSRKNATFEWQKYEKEVINLKAQIKKCEEDSDKATKFKRERDRLLKILEQKQQENSQEAQQQELARLEKQIRDLESEKATLEAAMEAKLEKRKQLREELESIKKDVEPTSEKSTLRRFLRNLPELDREDGKE